jgi:hypothetical protein
MLGIHMVECGGEIFSMPCPVAKFEIELTTSQNRCDHEVFGAIAIEDCSIEFILFKEEATEFASYFES